MQIITIKGYIEDGFDKMEIIEEYLNSHLTLYFEKIKNSWEDYKDSKILKKNSSR